MWAETKLDNFFFNYRTNLMLQAVFASARPNQCKLTKTNQSKNKIKIKRTKMTHKTHSSLIYLTSSLLLG